MINKLDISKPILMDNKNLRKANIAIKKHFDASEKEMAEFSKIKGLIRDRNLVDVICCPVCHSVNSSQLIAKWGGRYDECKACSHVYLKNPFKNEILTSLYKNSIVDQLNREVQKHSFNESYWVTVYKKYMNFIATQFPGKCKLIDVGCGTGRFLRFCKENYEFELFALDVYKELVETLSPTLAKDNIFLVDNFEQT